MIFRQVRSAKLSLLSALALITLLLEARLVLRYFKCCHASLLILKSKRSCYIRSLQNQNLPTFLIATLNFL